MNEKEKLLWEIERRGNRITTYELKTLGILQYQRALKQLRERLSLKRWVLTEAEPVIGQPKNHVYRLIKAGETRDMFSITTDQHGIQTFT